MRLFDLHCDTLYRAHYEHSSLSDPRFEINLDKARAIDRYTQLTAVWIPDDCRGKDALSLFEQCRRIYEKERLFDESHRMFLSVEGGAVLAGDLENVALLAQNNVKALTLTWNGENELGGGADTASGLTSFGKAVIPALEEAGVAVDLSHASERLFCDVMTIVTKPVIATPSNARSVCSHRRNLTDDQFKAIVDAGGLVGLNFHNAFLNNDPDRASMDDVLRHAEHFLSLGGEDALALGSDFDGGTLPSDMYGLEDVPRLYEKCLRAFGDIVTEKLFFDNAARFFDD